MTPAFSLRARVLLGAALWAVGLFAGSGVILTQIGRHQAAKQWMGRLIGWTFMKSVAAGAATQVYVATHPSLAQVNGEFFADCNPEVPGGLMQDDALAAKLWTVSTGLTADWLA